MQLKNEQINLITEIKSNDAFYHEQKIKLNRQPKSQFARKKKKYCVPKCRFNPNEYNAQDWMNLGLSEKQATVVLKFTKYGVHSLDKLQKIVVIPEELFLLIKDSVYFPDNQRTTFTKSNKRPNENHKRKFSLVELNNATQQELESIRGIGPFFAKQIVRHRDRLGGFVSVNQLMEVWKMNDSTFNLLLPNVFIETKSVKLLNINLADVEELKAHPYITWNMANSIVKMRLQLGSYTQLEQLKKSKLITVEIFEKIKPYLTL